MNHRLVIALVLQAAVASAANAQQPAAQQPAATVRVLLDFWAGS